MRNIPQRFKKLWLALLGEGQNQDEMPHSLCEILFQLRTQMYEKGLRLKNYAVEVQSKWTSGIKAHFAPETGQFQQSISKMQADIKDAENRLARPFEEKLAQAKAFLMPDLHIALQKIIDSYDQMEQVFKAKLNERLNAASNLDAIKRRMKYVPARETILDSVKAVIITILAIAGIEAFFSFDAIDAISGLPAFMSYLVCFGFSCTVGLCAHLFGYYMSLNNRPRAIAAVIAGTGMVGLIIYLRFAAPETAGSVGNGVLTLANIVTYGVGLLLALRVNKFRPYFKAKVHLQRITEEVDALKKKIDRREREVAAKKEEFEYVAKQDVYDNDNMLRDRKTRLAIDFVTATSALGALIDRMKTWEAEGIADLKISFQAGRDQSEL